MHALHNVVWKALSTRQAQLAEGSELARRFPEEISVLGAVREPSEEAYAALAALTQQRTVAILLPEPKIPSEWTATRIVPCLVMICANGLPDSGRAIDPLPFMELSSADAEEMLALALLTKPGPFARRTHELGRYVGIRQAGRLVAMAGERLCLPGYTEVSAVCTHPDFVGRGYARSLTVAVMQRIMQRNEKPFLHVRNDNTRAIELYRRLGYRECAQVYYALVQCNGKA